MAHLCINCNANQVTRNGDTFTCKKCKFVWDVAHEQENAAYLRAQGRLPAQPMGDQANETGFPDDDLLTQLGIKVKEPAPVAPTTLVIQGAENEALARQVLTGQDNDGDKADEPAPGAFPADLSSDQHDALWQNKDDDGDDDEYVINAEFADAPEDDEFVLDTETVLNALEATTVPVLRDIAEHYGVDLTGASLKADVIDRLLKSGKLTVIFNADGTIRDMGDQWEATQI